MSFDYWFHSLYDSVVNANSQTNGNGKISTTPPMALDPQNGFWILGVYNDTAYMTTYTYPCGAVTTSGLISA